MDGDSNSILSAIILLALLFLAAYFAVCETAFASVSRIRLKTAADRGLTKDAWTFMKWFVSAGAQSDYASDLTAVLGAEYKYNTANVTALEELPWTESEATNLASQFENLSAVKEYPGSYIIGRYVNFSFLDVYNNNSDPVQALLEYVVAINSELTRKRSEFGLATMEVSYSI